MKKSHKKREQGRPKPRRKWAMKTTCSPGFGTGASSGPGSQYLTSGGTRLDLYSQSMSAWVTQEPSHPALSIWSSLAPTSAPEELGTRSPPKLMFAGGTGSGRECGFPVMKRGDLAKEKLKKEQIYVTRRSRKSTEKETGKYSQER